MLYRIETTASCIYYVVAPGFLAATMKLDSYFAEKNITIGIKSAVLLTEYNKLIV